MKYTQITIFILVAMLASSLAACGVKSNDELGVNNKTIVNSEIELASYDKAQIVNEATVIMEGEVISKEVKEDFEKFPATDFTIKVTKVYKGEPGKEVIVRTQGGETEKMIYNPESDKVVTFKIGEKVVVFLTDEKGTRPDRDDFGYFVVGQYQGKFMEQNGKIKNEKYEFNSSAFESELKEMETGNEDLFNKLSESDKKLLQQDSPQEIIKIYYKAIMDRNYNLAKSCLFESTDSSDTIKFWDAHKSLKNLQIKIPDKLADGSEIAQSDKVVMFDVQYDVVMETNVYGEDTGHSLYFVGLKRNNSSERWKITVLGTAP
ncbi:DUF4829 domain-containing protein [Paenibacillus psychroresistens]|uniref:DUF4829 domain-containing protein n=1 Tax=Paenibacillus psychroresistens TaxID=1778678 RepID=A0A6B8RDT5_9BACL|nr:DUF4829 domain-containing protein [Paenibacillus psychroresistens]QGQ94320.1 DUF4829 domain-containing protein [Paenibacillus psychroresistens]